jgi:hypothetical protein
MLLRPGRQFKRGEERREEKRREVVMAVKDVRKRRNISQP